MTGVLLPSLHFSSVSLGLCMLDDELDRILSQRVVQGDADHVHAVQGLSGDKGVNA